MSGGYKNDCRTWGTKEGQLATSENYGDALHVYRGALAIMSSPGRVEEKSGVLGVAPHPSPKPVWVWGCSPLLRDHQVEDRLA